MNQSVTLFSKIINGANLCTSEPLASGIDEYFCNHLDNLQSPKSIPLCGVSWETPELKFNIFFC